MLNEEPATDRRHLCHTEQRANCIQLMVSWPNDSFLHLVSLFVLAANDLCKVLIVCVFFRLFGVSGFSGISS